MGNFFSGALRDSEEHGRLEVAIMEAVKRSTRGSLTGVATHQADAPYPGLGHGTLAHLRGFLPEEEVELVVVLFSAVWDEVGVDERRV